MCKFLILAISGMSLALLAGPIAATDIFRCVGSDRVIRFQDKPCLPAESGRRIELVEPEPPAPVNPPAVDRPSSNAVEAPRSETIPAPQPAAVVGIPSATLCTREDGSRYLSETGRGEQRLAPLGMLGVPSESLADAYGGPDGIGVSAPGLREPPSDHSRSGRLGALYTWVEDPCERVNGAQLCGFLEGRISDAERRLRLAFSDTSDSIRSELQSLHRRADHCPR